MKMHDQETKKFTEKEAEHLFRKYIEVCNQAIALHKDEPLFKNLFDALKAEEAHRPFELAVYDDQPKCAFSLQVKNRQLITSHPPSDVQSAWRIDLSELQHVVENAIEYIHHPDKLKLDWLKSRFDL